jgi:hypothetical protein
MPALIAGALAAYGSTAYAVIYVIATVVINVGLAKIAQSLSGKPRSSRGGTTGRDITSRGTVEPRQMVYGQIKAGGFIAFLGLSGTKNKYLHVVVIYAAHQCEELGDLWLDERKITNAQVNAGTGAVSTSGFVRAGVSYLYAFKHLGTSAQTADAALTGASGLDPIWTSNHRGAGLAYVHFRLEYSEDVWPNGAPSNFYALVKGRRLYDPRLDSTNGGTGSHRVTDATTWAYSNNWALCVRDYISGGSIYYDVATPNKFLGFGDADSRIDDAYTIAAANISDEACAIPNGLGGSTTQLRYTCDVQLSCSDTHAENLLTLKSAGAGSVSYVNGKYRVNAGAYVTPTVTLNEDDIQGSLVVSTTPQGEDLYNMVTGTFYDEDRDWQQQTFPSITNSTFETDDGSRRLPRNIELLATRTNYRAQRLGMLHLALSREKLSVHFTKLSPKALQIAENETFFVTLPEYGWSSKVFRCKTWEFPPTGWPIITAVECNSSRYATPAYTAYATPAAGIVTTPQYDQPDAPTGFTASSTAEGVLLSWSMPTPEKEGTRFTVYEYTASTPQSSATPIWSGETRSVLVTRNTLDVRYYWVEAVLNGASVIVPAGAGTPGQRTPAESFIARGSCNASGTTITKSSSGAAAWDSDCYSRAAFSAGCVLKFRPVQATGVDYMMGLNSDPLTDQSYTSLDHAWHQDSPGTWEIRESSSAISSHGSVSTSDVPSISYDGVTVRYYLNGILKREVQNPGKVFFMDSSFYDPGTSVTDVFFGALNSQPSSRLIARGNCVVIGNSIQKVGGGGAWDSDCYSAETFPGGCQMSYRPADNLLAFMIGLNSDPTTDQSYTSLDFAWYMAGNTGTAGRLLIYESGSLIVDFGSGQYTSADVFSIKYDGQWARYYRNATLMREVYAPGRSLFLDSSFSSPGAIALDVNFGPLTSATPTQFLARGNCQVSDANVIKSGGSSAWDSDCYSIQGYPVCHVSWKPNQTNADLMVGLNSDPTTDQSYTSLDYAFQCTSGGLLYFYESSTGTSAGLSYTTKTQLAITYDGSNVRYYVDGVLVRTTAAAGLTLFMDSCFYTPGGGINSLEFGPTTTLAVVDTSGLGSNAATDPIAQASNSGSVTGTGGSGTTNVDLATVTFTPTDAGELKLTGSCTVTVTGAGGAGGRAYIQLYLDSVGVLEQQIAAGGGGATPTGLPIPVTLSTKTTVSAGVSYTARLRVSLVDADLTKFAPNVSISTRIVRAEVNKR